MTAATSVVVIQFDYARETFGRWHFASLVLGANEHACAAVLQQVCFLSFFVARSAHCQCIVLYHFASAAAVVFSVFLQCMPVHGSVVAYGDSSLSTAVTKKVPHAFDNILI